jgi:hypothetical protein
MKEFLTQETPEKVLSLLGAALFSMVFLFIVSATDASLAGVQGRVADPFNPDKIMAVVDSAAVSYSRFWDANLFGPAQADLAFYTDNARWAIDNSSDSILAITGLSALAQVEYQPGYAEPQARLPDEQVAGAYTVFEEDMPGDRTPGILDAVYALVVGN